MSDDNVSDNQRRYELERSARASYCGLIAPGGCFICGAAALPGRGVCALCKDYAPPPGVLEGD